MNKGIKVKLEPSPEMLKAFEELRQGSEQMHADIESLRGDLKAGGIFVVGVILLVYILFRGNRA